MRITHGFRTFTLSVEVPANAPGGSTYTVGFDELCQIFKYNPKGERDLFATEFAPFTIKIEESVVIPTYIDVPQVADGLVYTGEPLTEYTQEQAKARAEIAERYGFSDIRYALFHRERVFSAKEYASLLGTYSDHIAMEETVRTLFFSKILDGTIICEATAVVDPDEVQNSEGMIDESDTRCAFCGTPCQEYKGPDGKIYCADCYKKIFRKIALGLSKLIKGAIR